LEEEKIRKRRKCQDTEEKGNNREGKEITEVNWLPLEETKKLYS